jgi:hypothetical protein
MSNKPTPSPLLQAFKNVDEATTALVKMGLPEDELHSQQVESNTYGIKWVPKFHTALFHKTTGVKLTYTLHYPSSPPRIFLTTYAIKILRKRNLI